MLKHSLEVLKLLLLFVLLNSMIYFGYITYQEAKKYENFTSQIANIGDAHSLAEEKIDAFTEIISLGLVKNQTKITLNQLKQQQENAQQKTSQNFNYFLISLFSLIIFSFTYPIKIAAISLSMATLISLIYGLITPILMVTIHKNVEYLGNVILSFESKGILGSIKELYHNDELIVAITILLFSVIIPILKSFTLSFTLLFSQFKWSNKLVTFFKQLGKWSMIDVFVVATLLVYLTSNGSNSLSYAEIQVGLYFFLLYVLLSMLTAILTQKVLQQTTSKA